MQAEDTVGLDGTQPHTAGNHNFPIIWNNHIRTHPKLETLAQVVEGKAQALPVVAT